MDETEQQIAALVKRFATFQDSLHIGDRAFAARYKKFVGSEKTWKQLRKGAWLGHIKPEKALKGLLAFAQFLDAASSFDKDDFFDTLPFVKQANVEFERLLGSRRDRRCLTVLAPEGIGKSWWASSIVQEDPQRRIYLRLSHTWREKSYHIAMGLAKRLGMTPEKNPANQMDALISKLRELGETVIILDEGHNGGVAVMKLIKDLIDETPARFVYMAFPTEFDVVRTSSIAAVAEARQFLRRCVRPIFDDYRHGVSPKDIMAFLLAHGIKSSGELKGIVEDLTPKLIHNYNLSTLADAVEEAKEEAEDEGVPLTLQMIRDSVYSYCSTPSERKAAEVARKQAEAA